MLSKKQNKNNRKQSSGESQTQLPDINERFINACETGDLNTVTYILTNIKDFNIEITDNLGRTALRLAVENEHLEIVQALLSKSDSQKIRDCLLLAIFLGYTAIAEAILKHPKYKILNEKKFMNGDTDSFWQTPSSDDAQFSPDITPVMLAAQYNRIEIVQILLLNGDRIVKPHDFNCKCTECLNKFKFDSLRHAQSRLNAYKGLASEAYISLGSIDPILTAFELSRELGILAEREKYFKHEYLQLKNALSIYSVKLLNNVRGRDELEIVLNKTGKEKDEKYEKLARLDLALKYQEKPFVAHSNCQQKIVEVWYTGVRKLSKMRTVPIISLVLIHIFTLPFTSIIYLVSPSSKIGKFLSLPCVKFVSHFASYLALITMMIISNLGIVFSEQNLERFSRFAGVYYINYTNYVHNPKLDPPMFHDFHIRPSVPSALDIMITIWIIGHTWHELRKICIAGIHEYLSSSLNIINFTMIVLFLVSYGLKYNTMSIVSSQLQMMNETFWENLVQLGENDTQAKNDYFKTFYWLNSDRHFWYSFDPVNLSEGLFAIGNLFLFNRLLIYLSLSQQLGPLQITLGKMINDIIKFIFIFLIMFAAFGFSLNKLYMYYSIDIRGKVEVKRVCNNEMPEGSKRGDQETDNHCLTEAEQAFGSLIDAFKTLFFALYLISNSQVIRINPFQNNVTLTIGYVLYGTFHVANVTILMSILIAMMTKSYENIIHHSDIEWKFARSRLYMEYIKEGFTLPVPLNLIPNPIAMYTTWTEFRARRRANKDSMSTSRSSVVTDNNVSKRHESVSNYAVDEQPSYFEMKSQNQSPPVQPNTTNPFAHSGSISISMNGGGTCRVNELSAVNHKFSKPELERTEDEKFEKLSHRIVMERVVKRYLMHNQDDTDDDPKLNELEDLKQELQMLKYDIMSDLKKSKDENIKNANMLNSSLQFVAEEVVVSSSDEEDENDPVARDTGLPASPITDDEDNEQPAYQLNNESEFFLNNRDLPPNRKTSGLEKTSERFIHHSFLDNFIDNFHHKPGSSIDQFKSNEQSEQLAINDLTTTCEFDINTGSIRKVNRAKVTFNIEIDRLANSSRDLYKITEESSEKTN